MRKFGLAIIYLFFALPIALVAVAANAAPIDSTASGVYLGSDRVCRVVLSRYQAQWVQADIRCIQFDGQHTGSLTTVYAPGTCPQGGAYSLTPWAPVEYLSLLDYDDTAQVLLIKRGTDQVALFNGDGLPEWWYRIGMAPSPSPYSCGPPAQAPIDPHALARFCRQYPQVAACRG